MFGKLLTDIFGTKHGRAVKVLMPRVEAINAVEPQIQKLSDDELKNKTAEFKDRLSHGETLDDLLVEAFGVVREASKRTMGMRHFDVQLLGGMFLHQGKISEMRTGEGKTLVATLPVYLNALTGKGVHVVTVNDYLAERDSLGRGNFKGMGNIYQFLGLTVGCIKHDLPTLERQAAYHADITYGTNNEFGFDYLRDNMVTHPQERVQRELNYAIVDEVDSILIDEARTPLIISGPAEESTDKYVKIDRIIPRLNPSTDYKVDEKSRTVALTEEGVTKAEKLINVGNLYDNVNIELVHHINQALKAHTLFKRDVDYVVKAGEVIIVDDFTGRLMPGRRYSDGLHQALEAKEKVEVARENQTLATISFQNYFRLYKKLCGMTGTADTEAAEFWEIYKLDVVVVPTNRPMVREDAPDLIYKDKKQKIKDVVNEIAERSRKGQPVLVGTVSIEKNEELSEALKKRGVPHQVLNAKQHEREAEIISLAGQKGAVTVATNMAGRGVDIVLGEGVVDLGGLHVIGTERHESRRIDNQLRGRSGRQGDPGSSRFYVAFEDDLMRIFANQWVTSLMGKLDDLDGALTDHPWVSRGIERAQKAVEGHNFEIRKHLIEYDDVMNKQREVIYRERSLVLEGANLKPHVLEMMRDVVSELVGPYAPAKVYPEEWPLKDLQARVKQDFPVVLDLTGVEIVRLTRENLENILYDELLKAYENKEKEVGPDTLREIERAVLLQVVDTQWKDHLYNMDQLKEGIGLRGYGQKDPLVEYKREGYEMFSAMIQRIKEETVQFIFKVKVVTQQAPASSLLPRRYREEHPEFDRAKAVAPQRQPEPAAGPYGQAPFGAPPGYPPPQEESREKLQPVTRDKPKIGRNDPCFCGSGKKYKKCHGA